MNIIDEHSEMSEEEWREVSKLLKLDERYGGGTIAFTNMDDPEKFKSANRDVKCCHCGARSTVPDQASLCRESASGWHNWVLIENAYSITTTNIEPAGPLKPIGWSVEKEDAHAILTDYRDEDQMDAIRLAILSHDMGQPVASATINILNSERKLSEYEAPTSLYGRLFSQRRVDMPTRVIRFNLGYPVHSGDVFYDKLDHVYSVVKNRPGMFSFFTVPANRDYDGGDVLCAQYRLAPSRMSSLVVRLRHYALWPLWVGRFIKSHLK